MLGLNQNCFLKVLEKAYVDVLKLRLYDGLLHVGYYLLFVWFTKKFREFFNQYSEIEVLKFEVFFQKMLVLPPLQPLKQRADDGLVLYFDLRCAGIVYVMYMTFETLGTDVKVPDKFHFWFALELLWLAKMLLVVNIKQGIFLYIESVNIEIKKC